MLPATIAFLYPAQSSLRPGLGLPWRADPAWQLVVDASRVAGLDLAHLLLTAGPDELAVPRHAEVATYVLSMMAFDAVTRVGIDPSFHAGHSVGQFSAMTAAGMTDFHHGLVLVAERSEAIAEAALDAQGGMAFVSGIADHHIEQLCGSDDEVWVASDNGPGRMVIAGTRRGLAHAGAKARRLGAKGMVTLPTDVALQTPLVATAAARFRGAIATSRLSAPRRPVFANVDGRPHLELPRWTHLLGDQLTCPIQWRETIRRLDRAGTTLMVELGPVSTLTRSARRTSERIQSVHVSTPAAAARLAVWGPTTSGVVRDRMLITREAGLFEPATSLIQGAFVRRDQVVGTVGGMPVISEYDGRVQMVMAWSGERMRPYETVAWLQTVE